MSSKVLSADDLSRHQISEFPYHRAAEAGQPPPGRELVAADAVAEAERAAYERGYREGEAAALQAAEQRLAPARDRLEASIVQLATLRPRLYRDAEQEVVRLALAIAGKIVRREIKLDPDIVATLVRVSLEKVSQATTARVRLNPDDYRHIAATLADGTDSGFGPGVVLVEDVKVESGGVIVETDVGDVDARIDVQLQEVAEHLLSSFF